MVPLLASAAAAAAPAAPLSRGYPAPPLSPKGSQLLDAWHHQPVTLKGISWPGFTQQPPGLEGLTLGGNASMEETDLHAIVYQLKLLGELQQLSSIGCLRWSSALCFATIAIKHVCHCVLAQAIHPQKLLLVTATATASLTSLLLLLLLLN